MAAKPRSQWSPAYRRRIERAEAKAAAQGISFSKKRARGKPENEYRARRASEVRRARAAVPGYNVQGLTPAEIRQLQAFKATPAEIEAVASLPNRHAYLRDQMKRYRGQLPPIPRADWDPSLPPVIYYYQWNPTLG